MALELAPRCLLPSQLRRRSHPPNNNNNNRRHTTTRTRVLSTVASTPSPVWFKMPNRSSTSSAHGSRAISQTLSANTAVAMA